MLGLIVRRVLATVPVVGVVALIVFSLLHFSPGDPAAIIAGDLATTEDVEKIRAKLGLDEPLPVQFARWTWRLVHGDLGNSIFSNLPVTRLIAQRVEPTLVLTLTTTCWVVLTAIPMGVLAAWRAGTWIDRAVMAFAVLGFSFPSFVIGYVLIFAVAVQLELLPVQGYAPLSQGAVPFLRSIVLPSATLGLVYTALVARMTRASMIEILGQDYMRTARAKGVAPRRLLLLHGLKNAAVPIVTTLGAGVALLIGGVVVTESVFGIPGLGRLTVDAIVRRDYPVIQGVILVFAAAYVMINLVVDLIYVLVDPRIRY
ncbi:MAG: ABC transporter permease [Alphaproteobacteria bacterium]|nr:ABC transporter permease [Alphaproteobacteria bacterium]